MGIRREKEGGGKGDTFRKCEGLRVLWVRGGLGVAGVRGEYL